MNRGVELLAGIVNVARCFSGQSGKSVDLDASWDRVTRAWTCEMNRPESNQLVLIGGYNQTWLAQVSSRNHDRHHEDYEDYEDHEDYYPKRRKTFILILS